MSLSSLVNALAGRLATEFNTVRGELSSGLAGKAASSHTHAESDVAGLTADLAAKVPTSRTVTASTGLTGGGALSADIALSVAYGTTSTTACVGNDSRLSNARTPTAHASSHATAGGDPIAPSDIGAVPTSRTVSAGTGLSGGGDLTANRSLSISFGTSSTTACAGNDSRLSDARTPTAHKSSHATGGGDALSPSDIGAVPTSRTVSAGTGLTGGGDLSADRSLAVAYGTSSTTSCVGNDSRLSDSRTPTGTAGGALNGSYPNPNLDAVPFPASTITFNATISADPTVSNNFNVTATNTISSLGVSTTGAVDGQMVVIAVLASGANRSVTPATGTVGAQTIPSGAVGFFGFRYTSLLGSPAFVCIAYRASA